MVINNGLVIEPNLTLENHYKDILNLIGEDPTREGLVKTPHRVAKAMQYITHGYQSYNQQFLMKITVK